MDQNPPDAPCFAKREVGVTHDVTWMWWYNYYGETDFLEERPLCVFRFRRVTWQLTEVHANEWSTQKRTDWNVTVN